MPGGVFLDYSLAFLNVFLRFTFAVGLSERRMIA